MFYTKDEKHDDYKLMSMFRLTIKFKHFTMSYSILKKTRKTTYFGNI